MTRRAKPGDRPKNGASKNLGSWDDITDIPFSSTKSGNNSRSTYGAGKGVNPETTAQRPRNSTTARVKTQEKQTLAQKIVGGAIVIAAVVVLVAFIRLLLSALGPFWLIVGLGPTVHPHVQVSQIEPLISTFLDRQLPCTRAPSLHWSCKAE
jgi:hypothetical protein